MTVLLHTTWFGTFLLEEGEVVESVLFPKEPEALAARMARVESGKILDEERRLAKGREGLRVTEPRLEQVGAAPTEEEPPFLKPEDFGYDTPLLREAMLALGREQLRRAVQPADHVIQAVRALDDLTQAENRFHERLRDWYGLHFPELARMVSPEEFVGLVADHGRREDLPLDVPESVGAEVSDEDLAAVRGLAVLLRSAREERRSLEAYLAARMEAVAPNVAHLVGPLIGARLLSLAGGLDELSRKPASTIQLLGAEKAMFRHLRKGTKPPKHGVLFQHPWVHGSPWWQRGNIARSLAGKVAIAARADAFTGRFIGDELKAEVEAALEEIRRTHPEPPARGKRGRPGKGGKGSPRRTGKAS